MRHRVAHRKLGRGTEHRLATLKNLAAALFQHERIETTLGKAKETRPFAEKLISRAREDTVHARRLVARQVPNRTLLKRLFGEIAPRFLGRPGGYTRIVRTMPRRGDGAEMAILELVVRKEQEKAKKAPAKAARAKADKRAAAAAATPTTADKPKGRGKSEAGGTSVAPAKPKPKAKAPRASSGAIPPPTAAKTRPKKTGKGPADK